MRSAPRLQSSSCESEQCQWYSMDVCAVSSKEVLDLQEAEQANNKKRQMDLWQQAEFG